MTSWIRGILTALVATAILLAPTPVQAAKKGKKKATYTGMDYCLNCHADKVSYLDTLHPKKIRAATAVLTTEIGGAPVSIFDSRTDGYATYVAPWASYFNEGNVEFTIGGAGWKQRFMTRVVPATVNGSTYSGQIVLPPGELVVMGIQWNNREQRWQDYHGPTGSNDWYRAEGRGDDPSTSREWGRNCGNCHVTGYDFDTRSWPDMMRSGEDRGVSCEGCHGPGSRHPGRNPRNTIRNPLRFNPKRRLETCGQCHGRGKSLAAGGGRGYFGYPHRDANDKEYRPGRPLKRFYVQDNPTDQAGSFWGNRLSKKHHQQFLDHLESDHREVGVDCITCHASHGEGVGQSQTRGSANALCARCHGEQGGDVTAHNKHPLYLQPNPGCVDCHMPYTAKSINAYDIRSHYYGIILPEETDAFGIPNACYDCHGPNGTVFELDNPFLQSVINVWDEIEEVYDIYTSVAAPQRSTERLPRRIERSDAQEEAP